MLSGAFRVFMVHLQSKLNGAAEIESSNKRLTAAHGQQRYTYCFAVQHVISTVNSLDCFTQPSLPPMPPIPAPLVSSALAWQQGEQPGQVLQGTAPLQQQQAGLWLGPW